MNIYEILRKRQYSSIFALIILYSMLLPISHLFGEEYVAPFALIILYIIAIAHILLLYLLLKSGVVILAAVLFMLCYIGWKFIKLFKTPGRSKAPIKEGENSHSKAPFSSKKHGILIVNIYRNMFVSGIFLTGFIIKPDIFRACVWTCLILTLLTWKITQRLEHKHETPYPRATVIYALPIIIIAILFVSLENLSMPPFLSWFQCVVGTLSLAMLSAGYQENKSFEKKILLNLLLFGFATGSLIAAGFIYNVSRAGNVDVNSLKRIGDAINIYDIEYAPFHSRLYMTTNKWPNVRYINTASGETATLHDKISQPRRIAVFPKSRSAVVGSGSSVVWLSDDLKTVKTIFAGESSIDIEKFGGNKFLSVGEASSKLIIFNLETGRGKTLILSGLPNWPYSVKYSPEIGAAYVGGWIISPYMHRIDMDSFQQKRIFNGFMNMGMCVDYKRNHLLVSRPLNRRIDILDAETLERKGAIPIEFGVREIDCDSEKDYLFALDHFRGILHIVNISTGTVLSQIHVGKAARAITYDSSSGAIYVGTANGIFAIWPNKILPNTNDN